MCTVENVRIPAPRSDNRLELTSKAKSLAGGQASSSKATPVKLPCTAAPETPHFACEVELDDIVLCQPQPNNFWEGLPLWQVEAPDKWFGSALFLGDDNDHWITDEEHQINDEIVASRLLAELLPGTKRKAPEKPQQAAAATATAKAADINVDGGHNFQHEPSSACRSEGDAAKRR